MIPAFRGRGKISGACFQNQPPPENLRGFGGSFWTALAACRGEAQRRPERSGDSAFAG
jgi:hypothetical protein